MLANVGEIVGFTSYLSVSMQINTNKIWKYIIAKNTHLQIILC